MKPNFLKRLWCFLTGCDMQPKNFMTIEEFKAGFKNEDLGDLIDLVEFLHKEPYLQCSKCGRVVK